MSMIPPRAISTIDQALLSTLINRKVNSTGALQACVEYNGLDQKWIAFVKHFPDTKIEVNAPSIGKMEDMDKLAEKLKTKLLEVMLGEVK